MAVSFEPLNGKALPGEPVKSGKQDDWVAVAPVPADAPQPPRAHYAKGLPAVVYSYLGPKGELLGQIWRINTGTDKEFVPLTFCEHQKSKAREWRFKSWGPPRPLYGLDKLSARPASPVILAEGEKAAEAAQRLVPDYVGVTSPGGSKAGGKADWTPLAGRPGLFPEDLDKRDPWQFRNVLVR